MKLLSSCSTFSPLKADWFVPQGRSCCIPSVTSDTLKSGPRPTYAHNLNVIPFCPKCQCKWKSPQKWGLRRRRLSLGCHVWPTLVSNSYMCSRNLHSVHTLWRHLHIHQDISDFLQVGATKQTAELSADLCDINYFIDLEAEGAVAGRSGISEQFVWMNRCIRLVKEPRQKCIY